jgi:uracil-DNA glycosylase
VSSFPALLAEVRACTLCARHLPDGPRPVVQIHPDARILIAGQAPGRKVHATGIPFNDPSGDRLRDWLGIGRDVFYDPKKIALLPMGFCYPGTGKAGDLPPRPECAATWREKLLARLKKLELVVTVGQYAIDYHLDNPRGTLTDIVRAATPAKDPVIPLPHPSPRNLMWLRRNPWLEKEVIPVLRKRVAKVLAGITLFLAVSVPAETAAPYTVGITAGGPHIIYSLEAGRKIGDAQGVTGLFSFIPDMTRSTLIGVQYDYSPLAHGPARDVALSPGLSLWLLRNEDPIWVPNLGLSYQKHIGRGWIFKARPYVAYQPAGQYFFPWVGLTLAHGI